MTLLILIKLVFSEGYKSGDFDFLAKIPTWVGSAGIKQRIIRKKRWKPETAIILNTYYNFSSSISSVPSGYHTLK